MEKIKNYVLENFEGLFILLLLVSVALINYFVYSKVAILNFYYLPIMVAGYYLGRRMAVLGAFFIILMVWIFVLVNREGFMNGSASFDLYFNLTVWGGFLILAGALVGGLSEKVKSELAESNQLRLELDHERELLKSSNEQLNEYSLNLEKKVALRTEDLERSRAVIESLKEKVENALFSVMDSTVARMMIEGTLRNEKRRISVLFSDLKDFTAYSDENPPEQVVGELNLYLNEMEECITHFFGHIDKYMGDGIMAEFGAPVSYQMHPLMAVLAGLSMQNRMKKTHPDWKMRIGIGTGPSVIGLFGSKRKSYSCIGNTANLASRLEGICEPGSVYIDEETHKDVKDYIQAKRVYALFGSRAADTSIEKEIERLEAKHREHPDDPETLFALGQAFFRARLATLAIDHFEKVLTLDPNHRESKLAFAEANMKRDEYEKIAIKGKRARVAVYQVLGTHDPLMNREKIPRVFYDKYQWVPSRIKIPEDLILPLESIDGSIGHGKMVAVLAYAIADGLGLSSQEKEDLLVGGFLHDLGNEILPQELLDTRRKLSEHEQNTLRKHPLESGRIIKKMGYSSESIEKIVETHHERWDGSGYPGGLKGEEIPLGGRILAVADTFDAMTSKRLYTETWEYRSALREIQKDASSGLYDPKVVETLRELFGV